MCVRMHTVRYRDPFNGWTNGKETATRPFLSVPPRIKSTCFDGLLVLGVAIMVKRVKPVVRQSSQLTMHRILCALTWLQSLNGLNGLRIVHDLFGVPEIVAKGMDSCLWPDWHGELEVCPFPRTRVFWRDWGHELAVLYGMCSTLPFLPLRLRQLRRILCYSFLKAPTPVFVWFFQSECCLQRNFVLENHQRERLVLQCYSLVCFFECCRSTELPIRP